MLDEADIGPEVCTEVHMDVNIGQALRGAAAGWAGMTGLIALGRRTGMTQMDIVNRVYLD